MLFHFAQNVIELATPDVALHLLIPFVIVPTVQPRRQLGALFERKLFDGSLNRTKAHVGDLTIARLLFQVPVIQPERVSIGSSDPISIPVHAKITVELLPQLVASATPGLPHELLKNRRLRPSII